MRKTLLVCVLMISLLPLWGCGGEKEHTPMERALALRQSYLAAGGCDTVMEVRADYGQRVHTCVVQVQVRDKRTDLTVLGPEEVAGIRARLEGDKAGLGFEDVMLDTGTLDDGGLTVLGALPALLEAARSGWIHSCGWESWDGRQVLRLVCRDPDTDRGTGREQELWLDPESGELLRGQLSVDGRTVIYCEVSEVAFYGG